MRTTVAALALLGALLHAGLARADDDERLRDEAIRQYMEHCDAPSGAAEQALAEWDNLLRVGHRPEDIVAYAEALPDSCVYASFTAAILAMRRDDHSPPRLVRPRPEGAPRTTMMYADEGWGEDHGGADAAEGAAEPPPSGGNEPWRTDALDRVPQVGAGAAALAVGVGFLDGIPGFVASRELVTWENSYDDIARTQFFTVNGAILPGLVGIAASVHASGVAETRVRAAASPAALYASLMKDAGWLALGGALLTMTISVATVVAGISVDPMWSGEAFTLTEIWAAAMSAPIALFSASLTYHEIAQPLPSFGNVRGAGGSAGTIITRIRLGPGSLMVVW